MASLASFQKAIDIDDSLAKAYIQVANEMVFLGDVKGAIAKAQQAIARSPQDPLIGVFHWVIGRAYFTLGNEDPNGYPNAINSLEQSVSAMPKLWFPRAWLIAAYALTQRNSEAKTVRDEFIAKFPEWDLERITKVYTTKEEYKTPTLQAATGELIRGLGMAWELK